mgnify:CR=1 FL=1
MFWVLTRVVGIWFHRCMASVKIIKTSKISSKKSSIVTKQEPVVKKEKFDSSTLAQDVAPRASSAGLHFWSAFKSFVLVGGDLV